MSGATLVSEDGKRWVKATNDGTPAEGKLRMTNSGNDGAYQPFSIAGQVITCQFTIKSSREILSNYSGKESFNLDPLNGDGNIDNYNDTHNDLITSSTNPKTYFIQYKVLNDGDYGFQLNLTNMESPVDVYITDVIWGVDIAPQEPSSQTSTPATNSRYAKGDVVSVQDNADAADSIICTRTGYSLDAAWAPSTAYDLGDRIYASGGETYQCIVAGTSDAVVEISGTARDIPNGTSTWDFIENIALFSQLYP
jgi:hypothetical protein